MYPRRAKCRLFLFLAFAQWLPGQSTQGLFSGIVRTQSEGIAAGAKVYFCRLNSDGSVAATGSTVANTTGFYVLPALPPGLYRLRAQSALDAVTERTESDCFPPPPVTPKFQAQERHDLRPNGAIVRYSATYAYRIQPGLYQTGYLIPDAPPGEYFVRCYFNGASTIAEYTLVICPK